MPAYLVDEVRKSGLSVEQTGVLEEVIPEVDIVYMTRIQRERFPDESEYEKVRGSYRLTADILKGAKCNMKVLHPLPRVDEIAIDVDETPFAYYFQQAAYGVAVRKALLWLVLGGAYGSD